MNKIIKFCILISIVACVTAGCTKKMPDEEAAEGSYRIYCLNRGETALVYEDHKGIAEDREGLVQELLTAMSSDMADSDYKAPLKFGFNVMSCVLDGDQLVLDLSDSYSELSPTREILIRAAIVRTLIQVEGVNTVSITVDAMPYMDRSGNYVGTMNADSFVDNEGVEINAYEEATLHLYFADANGDKLVECNRSVMYNTNLPLERLVLEQLIEGPEGEGAYPVVNSATKVISVTVTDGVCFVNLDSSFLESVGNVTPEVSIYSIVNSLAELSTVHKVQFMVNGSSKVMYKEVIDLEQDFSRNLDIVE
ncbi:MAG: GerMN domain-containing protein [Lachnospiraceae bacterium]|nr:GerMN domain-containing protein [Lachnospiraceae bacterium]